MSAQKFTQVITVTHLNNYCNSFSFRRFCMYITGKFLSLSFFACWTLNFDWFLVYKVWCFAFKGNIFFIFGCFELLWANFKQRIFLLSFKVSKLKKFRAFRYDLYFSPMITFNAVFCTLLNLICFLQSKNYARLWQTALKYSEQIEHKLSSDRRNYHKN